MSKFAILIVKNETADLQELVVELNRKGLEIAGQILPEKTEEKYPNRLDFSKRNRAKISDIPGELYDYLIRQLVTSAINLRDTSNDNPRSKSPAQFENYALSPNRPPGFRDILFLKKSNRYEKVPVNKICWIEAARSSLMVVTEDNSRYVLPANLKTFQSQFSHPSLVRVHRSFIVNIERTDALKGRILIIKNKEIPISESYIQNIKEFFPLIKTKF